MLVENEREPTSEGGYGHDYGPSTAEMALGLRLRRLRDARGMSQEQLARLMSVHGHPWHQTTVAKTEAGARPIRVNEVIDLARVFGLKPGDLLDTLSPSPSPHQLTDASEQNKQPRPPSQETLLAKMKAEGARKNLYRASAEVSAQKAALEEARQVVINSEHQLREAQLALAQAEVAVAHTAEELAAAIENDRAAGEQ
jgi:transcriptional regulator with XRE-family HTH domain